MTPQTVLIVGAGLAGARTAETLRAEGYDGRVLVVGDESSPPYDRPALSKEFLAGRRDEQSLLLRKPSFWEARGIELVLGDRIVGVDPVGRVARTTRGRTFSYDALVLATGARPRRLPLEMPKGVYELRTLADARALREELVPGTHLVVIGGGFVGAEVASTARELGVEVTIVEAAPAPVSRLLGHQVGMLIAERWRAHGVEVRLRTGVAQLRADTSGRVESALLTDGCELRTDAVLVGIGVEPVNGAAPDAPRPRRVRGGRRRRAGALDRRRARRDGGGTANPAPPRVAAAAALRLVGSVWHAPPDRRESRSRRLRRARGRRRGIRRALHTARTAGRPAPCSRTGGRRLRRSAGR